MISRTNDAPSSTNIDALSLSSPLKPTHKLPFAHTRLCRQYAVFALEPEKRGNVFIVKVTYHHGWLLNSAERYSFLSLNTAESHKHLCQSESHEYSLSAAVTSVHTVCAGRVRRYLRDSSRPFLLMNQSGSGIEKL